MTADITLRGPGDVIAVLPYQLGYHPSRSVVAVALRGRRLGLVARSDLPPDDEACSTAASLVGPLLRDGATSVIVLGYEDVPDASQPVLAALVEQLERAGVDVVDAVVVRGGRRFSLTCSDSCCPPDGVPLPQPADVPAVAEFVALGRAPLPTRAAVEGLLAPDARCCAGVAAEVGARARLPHRRRRSAEAWALLLEERGGQVANCDGLEAGSVADLVLGLADVAWRDGLIAWLAPGVLPAHQLDGAVVALLRSSLPVWGGMGLTAAGPARAARWAPSDGRPRRRRARIEAALERDHLLQRLLAVCRAVPDECPHEAAAICTVTAHVAWVGGDGAIARSCVERALRLQPDYRLAQLLEKLIDCALRLPAPDRRGGAAPTIGRVG